MSLRTVLGLMSIGATSAVMPTIASVLKTFEPMTLPTAMSDVPFTADISDTKNSGIDVPMATTVSPMTICGTFIFCASDVAPSVRRSAPHSTNTAPMMINKTLSMVVISYLWVQRYKKSPNVHTLGEQKNLTITQSKSK